MDNQIWNTYTIEYYSAMKKNEVLLHASTWMNLENIMISGRSQSQKTISCMSPFKCNVQNRQIHRDRKLIGGCLGLGMGAETECKWI